MLKGLTLKELAAKIEDQKAAKFDFVSDTLHMTMKIGDDKLPRLAVKKQKDFPGGSWPLRPLAHDQLGARLAIPSKYYDRMLREQPELLAYNVNTWFAKNPEKRMVRTLQGNARAFLSNRYQRIDNDHYAEIALPILAEQKDIKVVSCEITERRLYIQAVSPHLEAKINGSRRVGDIVQGGVIISNSEVGCGAASVADMDYFLACLNGMISGKAFRTYHVGKNIEDNSELWADDTVAADDKAVMLKLRDMIRAAFDAKRFRARVEKMENLTQLQVVGNPISAVEVLSQRIGATDGEAHSILRTLIEGGDLSCWGMLNAVTAQAHKATSYDRAVEFEAAGGQLLDLSPGEWTAITEADAPRRKLLKVA